MNLAADLAATAAQTGGKTALRHGDAAMSYRALDASSARLAALLARRGLAPGDRVGVLLPDVPALAVVVYGVLRAGAVVALLEAGDLASWAAIGDVRLLVAWHALAEQAEEAAARAGIGCLFVTPGEFERLLRPFPADHAVRERRDADVAVVWRGGALTHGELRLSTSADGLWTAPGLRAVSELQLITALGAAPHFYSRVEQSTRPVLRVGAVQHRWHPDPGEHRAALAEGVRRAAEQGAALVCLQEQTLSPYFAITADRPRAAGAEPEPLPGGPTSAFAAELAREHGIHVHASLYERADDGDGLGFNTAIVMAPDGSLAARTRRPGPADDDAFPVVELGEARFGFPTCWDRRFPELARAYALAGAEIIVYPTAIGSGPDHPDFDTEPLWEKVIVANGIANGTFMVAINRLGAEPPLTFYGSSFISDPYGRVLVQAPRDEPAVLVADLDLDLGRRRDWPAPFPSRSRPA